MGILIRCNDAQFTNTVGVADYPILSSLKNLYFMGGTQAESIKDKSGNGNNGTVAGTVTVNDHSVTFSGTGTANKITAQNATSGVTKITALALFNKNGKRGLVSNGQGTTAGFALGTERLVYHSESMRELTYTLANSENYYIIGMIVGDDGATVYRSISDTGVSILGQNTTNKNVLVSSTRTINFGGTGYNWAMDGSADIAVAAYYENALTLNQLKDAFSFLRIYAAKNGLTLA